MQMNETKVLEQALQNCQTLERYIYDSIRMVRRLNIRYNSDWLLKNYKSYMANIWSQYAIRACAVPVKPMPLRSRSALGARSSSQPRVKPKKMFSLALSARSSNEVVGSNRKINYKFIKIKRSMEALLMQLQHAIEISNRQRNYTHLNVGGRDSKMRICCH